MKACDRENTTALWDDDDKGQLDVEDPLVDDSNEDAPKKVYKPVCDEDGFVCSRIKPRVQVFSYNDCRVYTCTVMYIHARLYSCASSCLRAHKKSLLVHEWESGLGSI